jgi:dUTP pyrophosphatase
VWEHYSVHPQTSPTGYVSFCTTLKRADGAVPAGPLTRPRTAGKMAGKLGAKTLQNTHFSVALLLFKPTPNFSFHPLKHSFWRILPYPSRHRAFCLALTMAQSDLQSNSPPEVKEPLPKIPKLGQNGVVAAAFSESPSLLLRVKKLSEKAVLPSRASSLSAGYDLSRLK